MSRPGLHILDLCTHIIAPLLIREYGTNRYIRSHELEEHVSL